MSNNFEAADDYSRSLLEQQIQLVDAIASCQEEYFRWALQLQKARKFYDASLATEPKEQSSPEPNCSDDHDLKKRKRCPEEIRCPVRDCNNIFSSKYALKRHQATIHRGERQYICECGSKFGQPSTLKRHLQSHTGEKPYHCDACPRQFADKINLQRHVAIQHQEERES